ncbi:MBL fold metallo-hydrolase [Halodesulfovibrio sp.]|jgi:glyoxylase-like metal-dependent hydrolase (beta-lactamase superfamily II)|uniref:MBL fold metallo-hydrolase n=1 Tax=Halodesulfovibrio sp. TaxID=1912772 RepID=UPI0025FEE4B5|nr:MBL fold metallo-hydrolase [Halodesulfovibrio sp.]MCT4626185.1 MBL fold metallo-hydrolase [Halodesulfovibrio sp.]
MQVKTFPLGPLETNCYVLFHEGKAVAVDPGGEPDTVIDFLREEGLTLTHILVTHFHFDHLYGVKALHDATNAIVIGGSDDAVLLDSEVGKGGMWGFPKVPMFDFTPITEGDQTFMDLECKVLATPGHSPGSLSFYFPAAQVVFVGDVLFYRAIGRTDLPGGDFDVLKKSVTEKIFALPPETVVYSGHGPQSSVQDEQINNPYFSDFQR